MRLGTSASFTPTTVLTATCLALAWWNAAPIVGAQDEPAPTELTVTEIELGTTLGEDGRVAAPTTQFSQDDGQINAVIRLTNPAASATSIRVAFEPADGPTRRGLSLRIPARYRYRTVGRVGTAMPAGSYVCVVRTEDGRELARVPFQLSE